MSKKSKSTSKAVNSTNITVHAKFISDTKSYHKYALPFDLKKILLSRDHAYLSKEESIPNSITILFDTLEENL